MHPCPFPLPCTWGKTQKKNMLWGNCFLRGTSDGFLGTEILKLQICYMSLPVCEINLSNSCHIIFLSSGITLIYNCNSKKNNSFNSFRSCRFESECCELWPGLWMTGRGWWGARRFWQEQSGKNQIPLFMRHTGGYSKSMYHICHDRFLPFSSLFHCYICL